MSICCVKSQNPPSWGRIRIHSMTEFCSQKFSLKVIIIIKKINSIFMKENIQAIRFQIRWWDMKSTYQIVLYNQPFMSIWTWNITGEWIILQYNTHHNSSYSVLIIRWGCIGTGTRIILDLIYTKYNQIRSHLIISHHIISHHITSHHTILTNITITTQHSTV